ncbi:MAG: conjugal transfer protein TraF [Elusimicrobia bacterium]|nr:conjugal transfer protein TraF [Elusimicrobiota bacterium]
MHRSAVKVLIALLIAFTGRPGYAESWQTLGPQPMGMGGSFVGVARGNLAQYWNPAGLAQENNISGIQIPVGGRVEFTSGLLKDAHNLSNIAAKYSALQDAQKNSQAIDADKMAAFLQGIVTLESLNKDGKGILVDVNAGFNLKLGRVVLAVNNYTSVGGRPFVDTKNIGLGQISGSGGVTFSGGGVDTAISASNQASSDKIESAINTIGFTGIESLICGSAGCLAAQNAAITNADAFANALVDQAEDGGLSVDQISQAAQIIADNSASAATLIGAALSSNPYTNNTSNLTLRGASFTELSLGYARPLVLPGLLVGVNLKAIQGNIGYAKFDVLKKETESSDVFSDFDQNAKKSMQPGIDLGVLYDLNKTFGFLPFRPRVGAVARNINRPKFDQPDLAKQNGEGDKYALESQVRMGVALNPLNFWTLAADMDITENKTQIPGFKSRMMGAGTEINVFNRPWLNIPLRVGLAKNVAESGSKVAYTGGVGFNFLHFIIDIGGSVSTSTEKFTDDKGKEKEVPANASVAAQFALLF